MTLFAVLALATALFQVSGTNARIEGETVVAQADADGKARFSLDVAFPQWDDETYVMLPSGAYNGNRDFTPQPKGFNGWYTHEQYGTNCAWALSAVVPSLGKDGKGVLEGGSGDLATPCGCFWFPKAKKGVFVFFEHKAGGRYTGFFVTNGLMRVQFPARKYEMLWEENQPGDDPPIQWFPDGEIRSAFHIHTFDCESVAAFYEEFFRRRKMFRGGTRPPFPSAARYQYLTTLAANCIASRHWHDSPYRLGWVAGWPGGTIDVAGLVNVRHPGSKDMARQSLDFLAETQRPCGMFLGNSYDGKPIPERGSYPETVKYHLIRRSADALFYGFDLMKALGGSNAKWDAAFRKCIEGFIRIYERDGAIPQYVNLETGECIAGGTCNGAILPAALVKASKHFGEPRYVAYAKRICAQMCETYVARGLIIGGPGGNVSAPDSESPPSLLESCVTLAEETGEKKWIDWAKQVAHILSTWVVSYAFEFPPESEFGKRKVNSIGSVFASVANRHGAPAFCIDSGDSLLRLAKLTGEPLYRELYDDVRGFMPQLVCTPDSPYNGTMVTKEPYRVEYGAMHERVNTSGWEGMRWVGENYWRGCWSMTSFLLMRPTVEERLEELKAGGVAGGRITSVTNFGDYATVDYELNPTDASRIRCRLTLPRPEQWTGRMWGQGNGGPAGQVCTCACYALAGDAAVHTDMGTHFGAAGKREVMLDFGHRATHLMTVTGKALIERYYGRPISKAYFFGESTGGGQGLHEAERYPEDYDGIVSGVPANHRTGLYAYFLNIKRQCYGADGKIVLTDARLGEVADAALDCFPELVRRGVRGRYLADTRPTPERVGKLLDFLAKRDAFYANADIRRRLSVLFRGLELDGRIVGPGVPLSANLAGMPERSFWNYAWFAGPGFDDSPRGWLAITDADVERYLGEMVPVMDATTADLRRFAARGGKLIMYGGMEDAIVPWQPMADYFTRAERTLGGAEKAADSFRFYLEPGRAHSSGRAYSAFANIHLAIVDWVEKGVRPNALEAVLEVVPGYYANSRFGKLPSGPYLPVAPFSDDFGQLHGPDCQPRINPELRLSAGRSFFRRGDVWVLSGDSITHNDFYRQTVMAALDHFHPGNGIRSMNAAVWGQLTSEANGQGVDLKPTVVTIMLGMNNVIHRDYPATHDFSEAAAAYAETIRAQVKSFQKVGARVVLLKPTLTDETEYSYFAIAHTRAGLVAYGQALEKIAAEERCDILPFADDFELFKPSMPRTATLIPDGVHPYGWGQYALARALIHHFHVELPLAEGDSARGIDPSLVSLSDFAVVREKPFLENGERPSFVVTAPRDCRASLRWSVAGLDLRGEDALALKAGERMRYMPCVPDAALPQRLGTVTRMILTIEPGWGEPRVAVADFARTRVYAMKAGKVSGKTGPAEWTMAEDGSDLWLTGRVAVAEWPKRRPAASDTWMNSGGMNGLKLMWDFRPLDRFAEQRFDHDVNAVEMSVLEKPWSVNSQAWINRRVQSCLMTDAQPTKDGFEFKLGFRGRVNDYTRFDIRECDVFGCFLIFDTCQGGKIVCHADFGQLYGPDCQPRINPEFRLNQMAIFDRKGIFRSDETVTMGVFGL